MHRTLVVALALLLACSKSEKKDDQAERPSTKDQRSGDAGAHGAAKHRKLKQVEPPLDLKAPPADAEKTASGMTFKSLAEGAGASPGKNDGVKIRYSAWREDGTTFATTEPTNQPTTMWLFSTAPGFTEALQKMKVGGKAMFWLPPDIGYPGKPRGKAETLVYAVELVEVIAAPATPPDLAAPPADATKEKNGVAWKIVTRGDGKKKPRAWDAVQIVYTGWDETGKIFDSSEIHGKPIKLGLDNLPPVFADAVPKLAAGDRARLWFPAELLGKTGGRTPTGKLTFELAVVDVIEQVAPPPAPKDVARPPADAKKTPKGVSYKVLTKGTGDKKPAASDQVTVHYTGWTTDGERFDSSIPEGKPRQFRVTGVIPGWTDALMQMVVGDKWRVWIPEELAYKGAPNRPQGMLVFDVELISIDAPRMRVPARAPVKVPAPPPAPPTGAPPT